MIIGQKKIRERKPGTKFLARESKHETKRRTKFLARKETLIS
jgi:hypothetical protein